MADNDVQLEQKKRSRRRLVGAVALALVAAIVLPMIMDSEPKPAGSQLQIRIPGQEGSNFASRMIAGNAPPPSSPSLPATQSAPVVTEDSSPAVEPDDTPVQDEADTQVPAQKPATTLPEPAADPKDAPKKSGSSSSAHSEISSARSASHSRPSESDAQRARDILEGKPAPSAIKPASAPAAEKAGNSQKLYVQLGVFRDEANAQDIIIRAASSGIKAVAMRADGKTRLRAGPFADRNAADAAISKLRKSGINGIVVSK